MISLPLLIPALIATARAAGPLLAAHTYGSPPGKWLAILLFMMSYSHCSPTRCSTSFWRTSAPPDLRQGAPRPLTSHTRHHQRRACAGVLLRARWTPIRASCRRSSTSTFPWPSCRCAASSSVERWRSATCEPATQVGHALLRGDPHVADLRRRRSDHRIDLGQGLVGPLVGLERADPGLLSHRSAAFATYQPLRFSIEDPERQSRYASVFAIMAGAFVPLNFMAVRLAQQYVHPRV